MSTTKAPEGQRFEDSPAAQAEYFLDLMDTLKQHGTAESKRIRSALLEAISEYSAADSANKDDAKAQVKQRLESIQREAVALLIRSAQTIHKQVSKQSRSLGTKSPAAQTARALAEGMGMVVEALQTMEEAVELKNPELWAEAEGKMAAAKEKMGQFQ